MIEVALLIAYDALYRRSTRTDDGGTSTGPGNPTSFKGTTNTFNADNQVTNTGYGYDGNGSPTSYKSQALTFDPEQRMTGYNGSTQTDGYDGDGLRVWKQNSGGKTYFLYDGSQPVGEYGSSGTLTATNTFGTDGLVSRRTTASTFYMFDERGNASQRTSSTGAVVSSDLYDAYGARSSTGGADVFGYEGQAGYYTDAETGLVLCTHRYYDPSNGRWLTRDPVGYDGGINLYGYVGNDPVNEVDPSGYNRFTDWLCSIGLTMFCPPPPPPPPWRGPQPPPPPPGPRPYKPPPPFGGDSGGTTARSPIRNRPVRGPVTRGPFTPPEYGPPGNEPVPGNPLRNIVKGPVRPVETSCHAGDGYTGDPFRN